MVSGGQMPWQAVLHPAGLVYRALPRLAVTSILPIPVRNASLTTTALVARDGPAGWTWAVPSVAAVEPLTRTAATTARAAQDTPRGPSARRKVNLIDATVFLSRNVRPHSGHVPARWRVHAGRAGSGAAGGAAGGGGAGGRWGGSAVRRCGGRRAAGGRRAGQERPERPRLSG